MANLHKAPHKQPHRLVISEGLVAQLVLRCGKMMSSISYKGLQPLTLQNYKMTSLEPSLMFLVTQKSLYELHHPYCNPGSSIPRM